MERWLAIDTLKTHPLELQKHPEFQDDTELVQVAVTKNGMALQYASLRLRDDCETVSIAVKKNGLSLQYASALCKNNAAIVQQAVTSDGNALEFVAEELLSDRDIILKASHTCKAELIPAEFLDDEEVAWNLIGHDCSAFAFLSEDLRNNAEFVTEAVGKTIHTGSVFAEGNKIL